VPNEKNMKPVQNNSQFKDLNLLKNENTNS
jgi:hypothetical protein